jgi:beta-N-acetylhexosaminidase
MKQKKTLARYRYLQKRRKLLKKTVHLFKLGCVLMIDSACSTFSSTAATPTPTHTKPTPTPRATVTGKKITEDDLLKAIVQHMNLEQKLGQMAIVEFQGSTFDANLQQMVLKNYIGGVLIENKNGNAQTRAQLIALNHAMQGRAHIPLFITTDYEGGLVNELRLITGEHTSESAIGATGNPQVAYDAGHSAAVDLKALGLNVNFMPIVDVLTNPNNPGLPDRTFGSTANLVTNMGRAYLKGLSAGSVVGCLKHFPGLGSANLDPHLSLPTMDRSLATLNSIDLVPYRTMINEGIVPMVMVTHIFNPQLDPQLPTSLSPNVITKLLRDQLNFKGVIICDTLWMGGISNTYSLSQAAVLTVKAGTDLILGPRGPIETNTMLVGLRQAVNSGRITMSEIDASVTRILQLKMQYNIVPYNLALQLAGMVGESERRN